MEYKAEVNYNLTIKEMWEACKLAGNWDSGVRAVKGFLWPYPEGSLETVKIEKAGVETKEFILYAADQGRMRERDISHFLGWYERHAGIQPAKVEDLLALGAAYPELQFDGPIVALGSSEPAPHGNRVSPSLDATSWDTIPKARILSDELWDGKVLYPRNIRYLMVR